MCCRDGVRESFVVTKTFDVEQLDTGDMGLADDGTLFIDDIPANEVSSHTAVKYLSVYYIYMTDRLI